MKNYISPSYSLNKKNLKQIKIYPDPKRNLVSSPKNNSFINNISEICNSIYEDFFPYILKLSKIHFFEKFNKEADEIFLSGKFKTSENIKFVIDSKENIYKRYDKDYKFLSEEYQNFKTKPKNYKYLTHFRKHCIDTDYYAMHYCSRNKKGKFIEIKNKSSKNNEVSYVICELCKQCYLSKFILMLCNHCNRKYFSNILKDNEDGNILPATWKKYHCNSLINAIMKCIKCKNILYFNLTTKTLVCLNKKCNFNSKPESILWTCNTCNQEFRSPAKIYNPLEFQILKKSINYALLKQIKAAPRELPCHCKKNLSKLTFYHKEECKGELIKGILLDRPMLVCNKCKAINFEDKFTWICPICATKFHLHRVIGCRPFSKKKYIINKNFNKSERNMPKKKIDKEMLQKNLLNSSSISIHNKKEFILNNSVNNSHKSIYSKIPPSEDMNNISTFNTNNNDNDKFFKKIDQNKLRRNKLEDEEKKNSDKIYDYNKKYWIINLKKGRQSSKSKKRHSTLLEILKERMNSESKREEENESKRENNKFNKTMLPPKRITNHNIIKRRKDIILHQTKNKTEKNTFNNIIYKNNEKRNGKKNENILSESVNILKKEEKKDKKIFQRKIIYNNNIKNEEKDKKGLIKINFRKNPSPFRSDVSLKHHKIDNDKNKNIIENKEKSNNTINKMNNLSIYRNLGSNDPLKSSILNNSNSVSSIQANISKNNTSSILNSFRYWKRRKNTTDNESSENNNKFRFSKINDLLTTNKLETEPSYNEHNIDINISGNSSFRLSFAANNTLVKQNNNFNHLNEKKEVDDEKEEEKGSGKINNILYNENTNKNNEEEKVKEEEKDEIEDSEKEKEKTKGKVLESEESNYSEEDIDKIDDLKKLIKKDSNNKEKEEKSDKFNDSDIYEKNDASSSEDDEGKDTIKDIVYNSSAKKNFRESLMLKSSFIRQSILISQDKLNNLATKTDIPTINESDYNYLRPIGEGTYGSVYLVEHNETSEQFALKKIICRDYNELIKQKNELELIFSVKHENILNLYGLQFKYLDETTSAIYVLMELAQNDWNKEIKRRILAKRYYKEFELVHLLKQIIKGFLFLQEKNIAHRDIKPQNILLFPNNVYKIADFGEAKFIKNIAEQSTLRGSELYMSPLLYKGYKYNQRNVLHNPFKSDVFSLGYCLLYAMCLNLKVLEVVRELTSIKSIINHIDKFMVANKYSDKLINILYKMIEPSEDLRFDFEDLNIALEKL